MSRFRSLSAAVVAGETRMQQLETPSMASEDFAFVLGSFMLLGSGLLATSLYCAEHDFNDDVPPVGGRRIG